MTQHIEVPVNEEGGEGSEWVKMTEDVHLDELKGEAIETEVVQEGVGEEAGLGKEKYEELYNTLLCRLFNC